MFTSLQELKTSCQENYVDVDPSNTACVLALEYYEKVSRFLMIILFTQFLPGTDRLNGTAVHKRSIS